MDGTGSIRSEMPIERSREMRRDRACCGDHGNTSSFDALGIVLKSTSGRSVGRSVGRGYGLGTGRPASYH